MVVAGVVLAGGLARRMGGGDKPLQMLHGRTLLDHVIARVRPQVAGMVLNANGDPARFAAWGLPVVADTIADHPGPLAGVLAGLRWAQAMRPDVTDLLSVPADTPVLPQDLVVRLLAGRAAAGVGLACAASGGWTHPVVGLWPVGVADALEAALRAGERKIDRFTATQGVVDVAFPIGVIDPFFNVNSPEELAQAALARPDAEPPSSAFAVGSAGL